MQACPACRRAVVFEASRVTRPFARQLLGVFRYPLDAESAPYWIGVALVCGVLSWASALGKLFALCIFVGYLFTVIRTSASGATQPPMAADFLEVMDLLRPLLQSAVAVVVVSVPAILVAYFEEGLEAQLLAGGLFLFGLLWLPLASSRPRTPAAASSTRFALHHRAALPAPPHVAYAQVLLALLALALLASVSAFVMVPVTDVLRGLLPPLGYIVGYLHPLYFGMLAARVLGLFVFEHAAEGSVAEHHRSRRSCVQAHKPWARSRPSGCESAP